MESASPIQLVSSYAGTHTNSVTPDAFSPPGAVEGSSGAGHWAPSSQELLVSSSRCGRAKTETPSLANS
ncbi:hypothetical protein CCH79_00009906 [Gambusia affinis]|uniref:Uncharacterized protein n=1 Tax=Gambusia affinis TaxID=33528 RepID=A0A315V5J7_GAMAF|nr:hypothetical protein CCH79_00009906 [Gambusia affinis]